MLKADRNLFHKLQMLEFPTPAVAVNEISHKSTPSKTFGTAQPQLGRAECCESQFVLRSARVEVKRNYFIFMSCIKNAADSIETRIKKDLPLGKLFAIHNWCDCSGDTLNNSSPLLPMQVRVDFSFLLVSFCSAKLAVMSFACFCKCNVKHVFWVPLVCAKRLNWIDALIQRLVAIACALTLCSFFCTFLYHLMGKYHSLYIIRIVQSQHEPPKAVCMLLLFIISGRQLNCIRCAIIIRFCLLCYCDLLPNFPFASPHSSQWRCQRARLASQAIKSSNDHFCFFRLQWVMFRVSFSEQ